MREQRLNQNQVAAAAGVTQPAVSSWLKGPSLPQKRENWSRLAALFNVTEGWLREGGKRENISSNTRPDISQLNEAEPMNPDERRNPYEGIAREALQKLLISKSAKLPTLPEQEAKYAIGDIRDILDELEQRELLKKAVDEIKEPTVVYGRKKK